jgi:predicted NodU family carbamoyl transferase
MRAWTDADTRELYAEIFGPAAAGQDAPRLEFVEHHLAHACSAFYASGFAEAGVLVADGTGESDAMSIYAARHGTGLTRNGTGPADTPSAPCMRRRPGCSGSADSKRARQ